MQTVLLVQTVRMTPGEINMNYDLEDAIMMLHNIARTIEREWGFDGSIAKDIRRCADQLNEALYATISKEDSDVVL